MKFGIARFALNEAAVSSGDAGAGAPPAPAGSPASSAGVGSTPPPSAPATVDDYFDEVIKGLDTHWQDPSERQNPDVNPDEDFFGDGEPTGDNQEKPAADGEGGEKKPGEEGTDGDTFKHYTFKATVDGKEVERTFKTPEELNKALARAEVAPRLYSRVQKLDRQIQELQPDAEFARDMMEMAKDDPKEFLRVLEEELIDMSALSSWVWDKYHQFVELGNMTPEQQEQYLLQQEAKRIVEESRYQRQLKENQDKEARQKQDEQDRKDFNNWKGKEIEKWKKQIPSEYHDNILTTVKTVVAYASRRIDEKNPITYRQMSGMINKILEPYKRSMSPEQRQREVARAVDAKKDQATSAVRSAARSASATRPEANQGKLAYTVDDIFDGAIAAIKTGRNHYRGS